MLPNVSQCMIQQTNKIFCMNLTDLYISLAMFKGHGSPEFFLTYQKLGFLVVVELLSSLMLLHSVSLCPGVLIYVMCY